MSVPFLLGTDYLRKIQSVRPDRLVSLWPQNEPLGHGVSTEIVRGYHGAYTAVTLGQTGPSGLTSAGYDGATSFNNIYTAGFANDNEIANPGFETAGAGPPVFLNWTDTLGDGGIDTEGVIVHEGAASCKLTAGVTRNTRTATGMVVVPGERRRLRVWTRGDGANGGRYRLYDNTGGAWITPLLDTGITAAAWEMFTHEFTVPVGCVQIFLYLYCGPVNLAVCYFDACELRRLDGFLGDEGTVIVPARVANVGVWTDATIRWIVRCYVSGNHSVGIGRSATDNRIQFIYEAGGVTQSQNTDGLTNIDFASYGITWDITAGATGEVRYYIAGIPSGATDVGLGTWEGDLSNTVTIIGAGSTVPADVWSGDIAPPAVWSTALPPDAMRYLGTQ